MALRVLVADPDEDWLYATKEFLEKQMYVVDIVSNGKDAQLSLYNNSYFAIVLNHDVKNHNGVQVLKFIKTNYTNQRVVMIFNSNPEEEISDSDLAEYEDDLRKMGATEIIKKPFENEFLAGTLEGHQGLTDMISHLPRSKEVSDEEEINGDDADYSSIKIEDFYSAKAVLFDIFIRLSSGRYIKILHSGDNFSKDRIDKYKNEKTVEFLYFHKKDRRKFIQFNNWVTQKMLKNAAATAELKVGMLKNVSEKFIEEVFKEGLKPQVIDQGKEICESVYQLIEGEPSLYKVLKSFQDFDPNAYTHAFLTTLYSTAIIKQFEWQSKATIENTALACMFHDIGKMKLSKEILAKKPGDMSEEELEEYQKHPEYGVEMVEGSRMINISIKQMILQHHENYDGSGFPHQKKGKKVLTLANIIHLADEFVHLMIASDKKPTEALRMMLGDKEMVKCFNSTIIENFIKVFVDPGKIKKEFILPSNSKVLKKTG